MSGVRPYIVRQGDYIAKIAAQLGCGEGEIWDHEKNKELRENGRTKDVLFPGEVVFVPDGASTPTGLVVGSGNPLGCAVPTVKLSVYVHHEGAPLANEGYTVEGSGGARPGASDGAGKVVLELTTAQQSVELLFEKRGVRVVLNVGHLDPVVESTGQDQRLRNLGFLPPSPTDDDALFSPEMLRMVAIYEFQQSQGITASGAIDESTQKKLAEAHGR